MLVSELFLDDEDEALDSLRGSALWTKHIDQLDGHQLLAHYTMLRQRVGVNQAVAIMQLLKGEMMIKYMLGDIEEAAIVNFRPPVNDLVAPELLTFLRSLQYNQCAAILCALAEDIPLSVMVELTWSEVRLSSWSEFTVKILDRITPRLGCSFVFWQEDSLGHPTSCSDLMEIMADELNVDWGEFARVTHTLLRFEHFANSELETLILR